MSFRNRDYLQFVRQMPCLVCAAQEAGSFDKRPRQRTPTEAHHEYVAPGFSGGEKRQFDYGAVPLCTEHHNERHMRCGREEFWQSHFGPGGEVVPHLMAANQLRVWAYNNYQDRNLDYAWDQFDAYTSASPVSDLGEVQMRELVLMLARAFVFPTGEPE